MSTATSREMIEGLKVVKAFTHEEQAKGSSSRAQ